MEQPHRRMGIFFVVLAIGWVGVAAPQWASAAPIDVNCPAGASLNECVAQACQNEDGGRVLLKAGQYDANLSAALNVVNNGPAPLPQGTGICQGGVSIIGKGAHKTFLVANGPNPNPNPNAPPLLATVAIGSPNGEFTGHVEVRNLTIRCAVPGTCSLFGVSVFNAPSATISNVHIKGFSRGIQAASDNLTIQNNYLQGTGIDNFAGRGILATHPFVIQVGRPENLVITNNLVDDFWRGIVADSYVDVLISENAFFDIPQAIFAQNVDGNLEISENFVHGSDVGIFANLALFDPVTFADLGNTPEAMLFRNFISHGQIGIGLSFARDFEADPSIHENLILGTDMALVFDPDVTPPNLPPPPTVETYNPCLHDITLEHNLIFPTSSRPDLGECQP